MTLDNEKNYKIVEGLLADDFNHPFFLKKNILTDTYSQTFIYVKCNLSATFIFTMLPKNGKSGL